MRINYDATANAAYVQLVDEIGAGGVARYDEAGERTSVRVGAAAAVTTVYDGAERPLSASDGRGFAYDAATGVGGLGALNLSGLAGARMAGLSNLSGVNFSVGFRDMTNFAAMAPKEVTGLARIAWAASFKASWMNEGRFQDSYRAAERRGEVRFANTVLSGLAAPAAVLAETILRSVGVVGPTAGQMRDLYKHPTGPVPVGNQVLGARSIPDLYRQEVTARGIGSLADAAVAWADQALKFAAAGGAATACLAYCAPAAYTASAGLPLERLVLAVTEGGWAVYYSERGLRTGLKVFETEDEACSYMFERLLRDPTTREDYGTERH